MREAEQRHKADEARYAKEHYYPKYRPDAAAQMFHRGEMAALSLATIAGQTRTLL